MDHPESILVVEDDGPVHRLVQRVLEMHGYRVRVATTGGAALKLWEQLDGQVDLVLTDIIMPGGMFLDSRHGKVADP